MSEDSVRIITKEAAIKERRELIGSLPYDEDTLRRLGMNWELEDHERGILARINGLDFLMTGESGDWCCPCENTQCTLHSGHEEECRLREVWW